MKVRWHHIPTGIAFLVAAIICVGSIVLGFLASGGATVLHWMGWW